MLYGKLRHDKREKPTWKRSHVFAAGFSFFFVAALRKPSQDGFLCRFFFVLTRRGKASLLWWKAFGFFFGSGTKIFLNSLLIHISECRVELLLFLVSRERGGKAFPGEKRVCVWRWKVLLVCLRKLSLRHVALPDLSVHFILSTFVVLIIDHVILIFSPFTHDYWNCSDFINLSRVTNCFCIDLCWYFFLLETNI